jgi:4-carboxymuconolactone decarboxylase
MSRQIPKPVEELWKRYPSVWKAFNELGSRCHEAGPLDEKSRRLVKLALSIGAGLEGATHSAVRNARSVGITQEEIDHVALLAVSTLGGRQRLNDSRPQNRLRSHDCNANANQNDTEQNECDRTNPNPQTGTPPSRHDGGRQPTFGRGCRMRSQASSV